MQKFILTKDMKSPMPLLIRIGFDRGIYFLRSNRDDHGYTLNDFGIYTITDLMQENEKLAGIIDFLKKENIGIPSFGESDNFSYLGSGVSRYDEAKGWLIRLIAQLFGALEKWNDEQTDGVVLYPSDKGYIHKHPARDSKRIKHLLNVLEKRFFIKDGKVEHLDIDLD